MKLPIPDQYRGQYDRAMAGKSRQAAMRVNCLMCCGWQAAEVRKCTITDCPCYPYRMGRACKDGTESENTPPEAGENGATE